MSRESGGGLVSRVGHIVNSRFVFPFPVRSGPSARRHGAPKMTGWERRLTSEADGSPQHRNSFLLEGAEGRKAEEPVARPAEPRPPSVALPSAGLSPQAEQLNLLGEVVVERASEHVVDTDLQDEE